MPLVNCISNKNKCGQVTSSSCVSFEGEYDSLLTKNIVPCNANLDDIIKILSTQIKALKDTLDLSSFNSNCVTFDKNTQKVKDLLQAQNTLLCSLKTSLEALQIQVNDLDASNLLVNIDLDCLKPSASQCQVSTDTYTIFTVLNILKDEICLLKN